MDYELTKEQLMLQQMVRKFAQNEVKPLAVELDAKVNPKECFPVDLVKKASKLGLRLLSLPSEYGGGGVTDQMTQILVAEELGKADLGFASIFRSQLSLLDQFAKQCNKEQIEEFAPQIVEDDTFLLAACMTEPDSGTDANLPYDAPGGAVRTFAEKKGDEYIINGQKHFTSNGSVAKLYFVYARTIRDAPLSKGLSCFLVPHDTPGFSIGSVHNKLGRRLLVNAEEFFDDVHVPYRHRVGKEHTAFEERKTLGPVALLHSAAQLGTLTACYEEALAYAKIRVQGGRPIIEHPNVAAKLADMRVKLEAIRRLIYWDAWRWDNSRGYDPKMNWLIKGFTDEVSLSVINNTVDIFGGMATDKDARVQKYIRDIYTVLHGFGTGEMCMIKGAPTA